MISEKYNLKINTRQVFENVSKLAQRSDLMRDKSILTHLFSLIDLTSLNPTDTEEKISQITEKVNKINIRFPELPNVAAICVYPSMIQSVKKNLTDEKVQIVSVAGSFPFAQTFLDIKLLEIERVIAEGANEIDVVMSLGKFLEGNYNFVTNELRRIKEISGNVKVKVIIESGIIEDLNLIKIASFLALEAGADFIKTSTGKLEKGASPEAVWIICEAIKEYAQATGRSAGIKPAGGISDISSAVHYYLIVNEVLGNGWLNPERFRFGASKLANLLLGEKYF